MTASPPPTQPPSAVTPAVPSAVPPAAPAVNYGIADPAPPRRGVRFPAWLAVVIAALAAGGFAYLGWRMLRPTPPVDLSQYDTNDTGRGIARTGGPRNGAARAGVPAFAVQPEGVTVNADGNGTAVAGGLTVRFITTAGKPNLIATARPGLGGTPDDRSVVRARAIATNDNAKAKAVGLTDDQVKKLRATQLNRPQPIDPSVRTQLLAQWTTLRSADAAAQAGAKAKILDIVAKAAIQHASAETAAYHAFAEQVRTILNADQIAKLRAG